MGIPYFLILVVVCCLGWSTPCFSQQPAAISDAALAWRLQTAADTIEAVHELFQVKRKSSPLFLAATPVVLGLTIAMTRVAVGGYVSGGAFGQSSNSSSNTTLPMLGVIAGAGGCGVGALVERYSRYTKSSERKILRKYESAHMLPRWLNQQLARRRKPNG